MSIGRRVKFGVLLSFLAVISGNSLAKGKTDPVGERRSGIDMYLIVDGLKGDSIDTEFKDAIEVLAWSWGMSGGLGVGVNRQDISLTKYVDRASNPLRTALFEKKVLKSATLVMRRTESPNSPYMKIIMENITVSSVSTGGSGGESRFTENFSFSFEKMRFDIASVVGPDAGKWGPPFVASFPKETSSGSSVGD